MNLRTTYTTVTMPVSRETYEEVARVLRGADYGHAFDAEGNIDLTGLSIAPPAPTPPMPNEHPDDYAARMTAAAEARPEADPTAATLTCGSDTEGTGFAFLVTVEMGGTVVNSCRADEELVAWGGAVKMALERGAARLHLKGYPL